MRTNTYITVWHLSGDEYQRSCYRALYFGKDKLSKSGIKQRGYYSGDHAICRVPRTEKPAIELGDYVRKGKWTDPAPGRVEDLKVTQITENLYGTNPHTRLFLGRSTERS